MVPVEKCKYSKCDDLWTLKEDLTGFRGIDIADKDMDMMDSGNTAEFDRVDKPHPLLLLPFRWWMELWRKSLLYNRSRQGILVPDELVLEVGVETGPF